MKPPAPALTFPLVSCVIRSRSSRAESPTRANIMKMLLIASMPHEPFNSAVRDGTAGARMKRIMDAIKPEAAYFLERKGKRTGIMVVDVPEPSKIPSLAEPWFLTFQADVEFHPFMTPADLAKSNLEELGKTWG